MVTNHLNGAHLGPYKGFLQRGPCIFRRPGRLSEKNGPFRAVPLKSMHGGGNAIYLSEMAKWRLWGNARVTPTIATFRRLVTALGNKIRTIDLSTVGAETKLLNRIPIVSPRKHKRAFISPLLLTAQQALYDIEAPIDKEDPLMKQLPAAIMDLLLSPRTGLEFPTV